MWGPSIQSVGTWNIGIGNCGTGLGKYMMICLIKLVVSQNYGGSRDLTRSCRVVKDEGFWILIYWRLQRNIIPRMENQMGQDMEVFSVYRVDSDNYCMTLVYCDHIARR